MSENDESQVPINRAETGPMQFGDDWPGLFLRGDNALVAADYLEMAVEDRLDEIGLALLSNLVRTLRECHVRTPGHKEGLTQLKEFVNCSIKDQKKKNGQS